MKKSALLTAIFISAHILVLAQTTTEIPKKDTPETIVPLRLKNEVLFSLGGNLNFVEKTQVSGLYYDVNIFCDPLFTKNNKGSRWGIDARLNQGKYISQPDSSENRKRYYSLDDPDQMDSVSVLIQNYTYIREELPTYVTVSMSPTYRLGNAPDFPLFFALHLEYIQQKNNLNIEYIINNEIESKFDSDKLPGSLSPVKIENGKNKINTTDHNFNYGIGLKFFKEFEDAAVNIKPILGYGSNKGSKGLFYFTHFEVTERKLGFKIGGELRGIIRLKEVERVNQSDYDPYLALYFAKTFRFSKFLEILKLN